MQRSPGLAGHVRIDLRTVRPDTSLDEIAEILEGSEPVVGVTTNEGVLIGAVDAERAGAA